MESPFQLSSYTLETLSPPEALQSHATYAAGAEFHTAGRGEEEVAGITYRSSQSFISDEDGDGYVQRTSEFWSSQKKKILAFFCLCF